MYFLTLTQVQELNQYFYIYRSICCTFTEVQNVNTFCHLSMRAALQRRAVHGNVPVARTETSAEPRPDVILRWFGSEVFAKVAHQLMTFAARAHG